MKIQIKNRFSGHVIFETDAESLGAAILVAIETKVDLSAANLSYADLSSADLSSADLSYADLRSANLSYANLSYADLSYANLSSADLRSANLSAANLSYAKNSSLAVAMTRILPDGALIGWKKCREGVLVKLSIPAEAKRSSAFGRKCRAEFATVLEVIGSKVGVSSYDSSTTYKVGETVTPANGFDADWTQECAGGIHFYITREEAEAHV